MSNLKDEFNDYRTFFIVISIGIVALFATAFSKFFAGEENFFKRDIKTVFNKDIKIHPEDVD